MERIEVEGWHGRAEFDGEVLAIHSTQMSEGKQFVPGAVVNTILARHIIGVSFKLREGGDERHGYWPPGHFGVTTAGGAVGIGFEHQQAPAFENFRQQVLNALIERD
ncbi:hypothetical protein L3Q67_25755 [Saccharothrix sp. AJ9571]|nr:hypothetical protein L3Q67_25755 [Saccharothrix sp. AJ9571]